MKIPAFVPLLEKERKRREISGFIAEVLCWGYIFVVITRIIGAQILFSFLENIAYSENSPTWISNFVKWTNYDTRYPGFEWSTLAIIYIIGGIAGILIGLTGKGFGTWVASLSKLQVHNPEDSIKITKHWAYARFEGYFLLLLTLIAGWVITKVNLAQLFEAEGLMGFGRLTLSISCGIPGIGNTDYIASTFGGTTGVYTIYNGMQWFFNLFIHLGNFLRITENALPEFASTCIPSNAAYYGVALSKLSESVYLAFMATFFSVPISFLLSFFCARNLTRHSKTMRAVYTLLRMYMNIIRSIEPLIWAILFAVWIGIGPFAGSIALMVHSVSSLVKQYSEAVEGVDEGPLEALQATGSSRIATVWYAVVPQIVLPYLAFTIFRWDINVRMATIIGMVGGGGIGGLLVQEQGLANYTAVGTIGFLIFVVVWAMDFLSARVREAIQ